MGVCSSQSGCTTGSPSKAEATSKTNEANRTAADPRGGGRNSKEKKPKRASHARQTNPRWSTWILDSPRGVCKIQTHEAISKVEGGSILTWRGSAADRSGIRGKLWRPSTTGSRRGRSVVRLGRRKWFDSETNSSPKQDLPAHFQRTCFKML